MDEKELLKRLGLDKFESVEALSNAYKSLEKKMGGSEKTLFEQLSEMTAAERAQIGIMAPQAPQTSQQAQWKPGASKLEGDLANEANRLIAERGIPAEQADIIVKDLHKRFSGPDSTWEAQVNKFFDSDSKGELAVDGEGNRISADRNGEFVQEYLEKYNRDPVQFQQDLLAEKISMEELKLMAAEGRKLVTKEKSKGIDVSIPVPDFVNPKDAPAEYDKFFEDPALINSLNNPKAADHERVKTRFERVKAIMEKTDKNQKTTL